MKRIVALLALRPDCHFPCGALTRSCCLPLALWAVGSLSPKTRFWLLRGVFATDRRSTMRVGAGLTRTEFTFLSWPAPQVGQEKA